MSITVPMPVSGFPPGSDRLVSTRINGVTVALPCFDWCTSVHHSEDHRFVEDFSHASEPLEVALNGEELFSARLISYPHCSVGTKVAVDIDGESIELDGQGVEDSADLLITAAARIRKLGQIGGVR